MTKRILHITLVRHEGRIEEVDKPITVSTLKEANSVIQKWRSTAPGYGEGYDKAGFIIYYADGSKYEGRYDLNKARGYADAETLEKHIALIRKWRNSYGH